MYDDDKDVTYPFNVKASRKKRNNSHVMELIKEAVRDRKRKDLAKQKVPGGKLRPVTDTPYTRPNLVTYRGCMKNAWKNKLRSPWSSMS